MNDERKIDPQELRLAKKLAGNFPLYAENCLSIRSKEGRIVPLKLNAAQIYIHEKAEDQLRRTGRVRKIIVKGRQQGCSTYIEGRLYWKVTHNEGMRAFILTHEQEATNNLFEMAQRFNENVPDVLGLATDAENAKELIFRDLDSGYRVGTAGTKGKGRSQTIQFFHGSEVAYWPFAETHASGIMQAIPISDGTESWLESTANGASGYFYTQWQKAVRGEGEYEPIFIPWYWQPEYSIRVPEGFTRTEEESDLAQRFMLTDGQLAWRRAKISELDVSSEGGMDGGETGDDRFRREYPNTPEEAFAAPVIGAYYGKLMASLDGKGRIREVPHEPELSVYTAWDLGIGDSTAIWFAQVMGGEVRLIDYYENSGVGLDHYAKVIKGKPYSYADHYLPHDADVSELGTGRTRVQTLAGMGVSVNVQRRAAVDDGIMAVRQLLPKCYFDKEKCERGIECLRQYRRKYDEALRTYRAQPLHDWTSHGSDAMRTLAMALPVFTERDAPKRDRWAEVKKPRHGSWMAAY